MEKEKILLPIYLAVGEDDLKRKRSVERFKNLANPAFRDFNVQEFSDSSKLKPETLSDALEQLPQQDSRRFIIIHDASSLSKEAAHVVLVYLEKPSSTTTILLEAKKFPKTLKLRKKIETFPGALIACDLEKGLGFRSYVVSLARTNYHLTLAPDAAQELIDRLGQDSALIANALASLAQRPYIDSSISKETIESSIARIEKPKPWSMADAVAAKDAEQALSILEALNQTDYTLYFFYVLNRLRELIAVKAQKEVGTSLDVSPLLAGPAWRYKNHMQAAKKFSMQELEEGIKKAPSVEASIKGGADSYIMMSLWLISLCKRRK